MLDDANAAENQCARACASVQAVRRQTLVTKSDQLRARTEQEAARQKAKDNVQAESDAMDARLFLRLSCSLKAAGTKRLTQEPQRQSRAAKLVEQNSAIGSLLFEDGGHGSRWRCLEKSRKLHRSVLQSAREIGLQEVLDREGDL